MEGLAIQTVTVTDITYISVMNMKTECLTLVDGIFTKWQHWVEFVTKMKTQGLTFKYDGNNGCCSWHFSAWTLHIPINVTTVSVTGVLSIMIQHGTISRMQKERQVQTKAHTWFSLYDTAQAQSKKNQPCPAHLHNHVCIKVLNPMIITTLACSHKYYICKIVLFQIIMYEQL
jgi:hypothetical protein